MEWWFRTNTPLLNTPSLRLVSGLASHVFFAFGPNGSG